MSDRINYCCKFVVTGMYFRVIGVIEPMNELFLEPAIPEYIDELQLSGIGLYGIEWDIEEIME